jgi:Tol biopolymer transport system component
VPLVHAGSRERGKPDAVFVRAQLDKVLSSQLFLRSDRLSAFLTFIVEETLEGRGDTLKEHVIAIEVYGKGPEFNTASDPIVRVDARRLRDKLREYYASTADDPLVISVPKGSYTPDFEAKQSPPAAIIEARTRPFGRWVIVGTAIVLMAVTTWYVARTRGTRRSEPAPGRLLTVTAFPGLEGGPPALSADGNFVAFAWTGPNFLAPGDLWVKAVDGDALRRLTDTPQANEVYPAWSPDGRQIAFSRTEGEENRGVYIISALGGSERKVADWGWSPTWIADSQSLIIAGRTAAGRALVQYAIETGASRVLTTPPSGFLDEKPKVSPDGRSIAFVRSTHGQSALFVLPIAGGEPVQVDAWVRAVGSPDWTPDSREIFYPRWDASGSRVFRIAAAGGRAVPAAGLPTETMGVSVSGFRPGGTFRVSVVDARSDVGLRMIDVRSPLTDGRFSTWTPLCDSTRLDWPARFSRDGTRVSFTSDRNGPQQIFVANRDGSGLRALTPITGVSAGLASWSPDGQSLVFDAVASDNLDDLYVVGRDGGPLRRLTHDDKHETKPEWSRDGRWIYYASDASGRDEIWKVPAAGGTPVRLTTQGGAEPHESPDGRAIYFVEPLANPSAETTLRRVSVDGGSVNTVLSGIRPGAWDVADGGIFFLTSLPGTAPVAERPNALDAYSFEDQRTRRVGEIPFPVVPRGYSPPRVLTVSPDGRWAIVSHMDNWTRDIMVADNVR